MERGTPARNRKPPIIASGNRRFFRQLEPLGERRLSGPCIILEFGYLNKLVSEDQSLLQHRVMLTALLVFLSAPLLQAKEPGQPNILFIFADDQAFDTIGAHGNDEIQTPTLDSLAKRGVTFSHAYNQGGWNGAICVASRTMLVTGRFLWKANASYNTTDRDFREKGLLWPQLLQKAGYETYFSGKWHIRADAEKAFMTARHVRPGMPNQTPAGYNRPIEGKEGEWKPWDKKFEGFWKGGVHWSEVLANDAVDYLHTAAKSERPFFMYLAFNAPHDPRQSPKRFVDRYPLEDIAVPKSFLPLHPFEIGSNKIRDERLAPFPRTEYSVKVNRQEYYAIITHMDEQIARILKTLKETGQADNTYIFFSADHGLSVGRHGLIGKQNMYDHSVRIPFMVVGPNVPADKRIDSPIYVQDVMPTTLALAGADKPDHVDFQSLLPLIRGETTNSYESIYGAYLARAQRMVTHGGFKLILYPGIKKSLLFDLKNDPLEMDDLSELKPMQAKAKLLFSKLRGLQTQTGDTLDLGESFPELQ